MTHIDDIDDTAGHCRGDQDDGGADGALQARLRALRQDPAPGRDLWPGIAAAIAAPVAADPAPEVTAPVATRSPAPAVASLPAPASAATRGHHRRPRRRALVAWSAAASVAALAVALGWSLRPGAPGTAVESPAVAANAPAAPSTQAMPVAADASPRPMLLRQADAMSREYAGALREVEASRRAATADPALAGAAGELDRSAAEIRTALAQAPDSRFLVERLQRVYAQRLALARRVTA